MGRDRAAALRAPGSRTVVAVRGRHASVITGCVMCCCATDCGCARRAAWRRSLSLPEQVEAMVNYIVEEPAADANDKSKFVYPYKVPDTPLRGSSRLLAPRGLVTSAVLPPAICSAVASTCCDGEIFLVRTVPFLSLTPFTTAAVQSSEVLSSDVGSIHDCLLGDNALLDKLFTILNAEEVQYRNSSLHAATAPPCPPQGARCSAGDWHPGHLSVSSGSVLAPSHSLALKFFGAVPRPLPNPALFLLPNSAQHGTLLGAPPPLAFPSSSRAVHLVRISKYVYRGRST